MIDYKKFVVEQLLHKAVRFSCDCVIKFDITGFVDGYEIVGSEIIYLVNTGEKVVKIAENTPKLKIEIL